MGASRWSSGEDVWIGALGEVPARRPVGVLVGPTWGRPGDSRESGHLADDGIPHAHGVVAVRQVREDGEPDGTLHEGADGTAVAGPANEVTLPVAGDGSVGGLRRRFANHDHGFTKARAARPPVAA